ncbi:MAG: rhodanese-like domain-containing protein [Candidatus Dormibacteraeota bacterium]|nr:rhodanese-like domain-containing protein [Candidatus Dormibacteraeota bacterium]
MRTRGFLQGRDVEYDEVSLDQAEELRAEGASVLDVRRVDERKLKHIPRSVHIPIEELAGREAELPEGRLLVVCATGVRSGVAAAMIEAATGRMDVSSIAGGTNGWEVAGKPVDRG